MSSLDDICSQSLGAMIDEQLQGIDNEALDIQPLDQYITSADEIGVDPIGRCDMELQQIITDIVQSEDGHLKSDVSQIQLQEAHRQMRNSHNPTCQQQVQATPGCQVPYHHAQQQSNLMRQHSALHMSNSQQPMPQHTQPVATHRAHAPEHIPNEYMYTTKTSPSYILPSPPDSGSEPPYSPENRLPGNSSTVQPPSLGVEQVHTQGQYAHFVNGEKGIALHPTNPPSEMTSTLMGHLQHPQGQRSLVPQHNAMIPQPASNAAATHHQEPRMSRNGSIQGPSRKRSRPVDTMPAPGGPQISPTVPTVSTISTGVVEIKPEPADVTTDVAVEMPADDEFTDNRSCANLKWQQYCPSTWANALDQQHQPVLVNLNAEAEKGFTYSAVDEAFICQKKNHFQVSLNVSCNATPVFINSGDNALRIEDIFVDFFGVKTESPSQRIKIEQSQQDRSKKPLNCIRTNLSPDSHLKLCVGRLHFSETTVNNMRRKGKPNPDQRYFCLVVTVKARAAGKDHLLAAVMTEKIIVRASNPGQFENDTDVMWKVGPTGEAVYTNNAVGIGTNKPDQQLTVHGNMRLTGQFLRPSDQRVKEDIEEVDPKVQLDRVRNMRIYNFRYVPEYGAQAGMSEDELEDIGVLAQDVQAILPDAVRDAGDVVLSDGEVVDSFLVVNKDRIFMENVGAVKELCKLTDSLEGRIGQLEKMNRKINKLRRWDSLKSTSSGGTIRSALSGGSGATLQSTCSTPRLSAKRTEHKVTNSAGDKHMKRRERSNDPPSASSVVSNAAHTWCHNRFVQIIIITLVLIMAFCLVSITTLYIVEKTGNKSTTVSEVGVTEPSRNTDHGSHQTTQPTQVITRPPVPQQPILGLCHSLGDLAEAQGACEALCQCIKDDTKVVTIPPIRPGPDSGKSEEIDVHGQDGGKGTSGKLSGGEQDDYDYDIPSSDHDTAYSMTTTEGYSVINMDKNKPAVRVQIGHGRKRRSPSSGKQDVAADELMLTSARVLGLKSLGPNSQSIPYNYNVSLTDCLVPKEKCRETPSLHSSVAYYIPVSQDLPQSLISFQLKARENSSVFELCETSAARECYKSEDEQSGAARKPPHEKLDGTRFLLPVGYYAAINYTFHVIPAQYADNEDRCKKDGSIPYVEYSFFFYRYCSSVSSEDV